MPDILSDLRRHLIPWYGWRPDVPDFRDLPYRLRLAPAKRPTSVDLRPKCPPVYDQGELGSCTGNAIAANVDFLRIKQGLPVYRPSRLFIYYNERVMEGTVSTDAGAEIRDGIKSIASLGVPDEALWPYDVSQFAAKPPDAAYAAALSDTALRYERIDNVFTFAAGVVSSAHEQMLDCLASGCPFVFGFAVYESFESQQTAQTGVVWMPGSGEQMLGGHAVMAVGYDDDKQRFLVRNSWGADWGMEGYFTMPYDYLSNNNLASDFWAIQLVGSKP